MQIINSNKIKLFAVIITAILINFAFVGEIKAQPPGGSYQGPPIGICGSGAYLCGNCSFCNSHLYIPCPDSCSAWAEPKIDSVALSIGTDTCWMHFDYITRTCTKRDSITGKCETHYDLDITTVYFPGSGCGDVFMSMFQSGQFRWFDSAWKKIITKESNPWGVIPPNCFGMSNEFWRISSGGCYMWGPSPNPNYPSAYIPCPNTDTCKVKLKMCVSGNTSFFEIIAREGPSSCPETWCSPACNW